MRLPLAACLVLTAHFASAADWPQFFGPQRNGHADAKEKALPDSLSGDLKPLWEKSAGSGFAGPVVVGGKVILFHREGSDMTAEALDAATGKPLWRTVYITDYVDSFGFDNGPRAVPAVAGDRVFTFGPEGRVTAMSLNDGKELWIFDTASALQSGQGFFGRAPSPLVVGDKVIIAAGGTKDGKPAGLVALDTASGKVAWTSVEDEAGYASPVMVDDKRLLAWMRNQLWLVDTTDGKVITSRKLRSSMDASVNAATPVACGDDRWLVSAGYGVGAHLLGVMQSSFAEIWQKEDTLDCHYATPVRVGDYLYGFHGRQESGMKLRCIEIATGKVAWEDEEEVRGGTMIVVNDKLLVFTEMGELWLVRANPAKYEKLAAVQVTRAGHRCHAALADGVLYLRDAEKLVALKLN
ncbi:PQQ-binding-like beta-propeller repeat protein [Brevifollis gellanilyticus]|uniref:Alcohol dehydrogenase n=1 Tax=Brevifollis gellanilyticus TaxID=748831 RepID=A0A512M2J7_9BACT|nr:PQQ-binding-like beta-propeller repeat protein [Brevifollis gellanilyticus]GEP40967.1 alcohol dehydrogenase [Brevifollis gellanilyticus]